MKTGISRLHPSRTISKTGGCLADARGPRSFQRGIHFVGLPGGEARAFDSYNSYCGKYEVKTTGSFTIVELRLFPNWSGGPQERYFEFFGDHLILPLPRPCPMAWNKCGSRFGSGKRAAKLGSPCCSQRTN